MRVIEKSELIINNDGSIFHLHLKPEDIADTIILVGDPGRVDLVASFFDSVEVHKSNREFVTKTGLYKGKRMTVMSTGIGTDNIDIVLNELDALVNIDFKTRTVKKEHQSLKLVRIGTSGSLQKDLPVDSWLLSEKGVGFDGLINFYADREKICDHPFEDAFKQHLHWNERLTSPYVVNADTELLNCLVGDGIQQGVTISAPGFYGPQGRVLRLNLLDPELNNNINSFRHKQLKITNFEMECSAIYGLSALLGHQAATVCAIIANRLAGTYSKDYKSVVKELIKTVLERLYNA